MNSFEMEQDLARHGFTSKEISAMRKHLEQAGTTYLTLLSELRMRFIVVMIIVFIIILGFIYTIVYEEMIDVFGFILAMAIAGPILYFLTSLKLGAKSFFYMRKR